MVNQKSFFQKVENRRAIVVGLIVALALLAADMLKTAAAQLFLIFGGSKWSFFGTFVGYGIAVIVILLYLSKLYLI